jgi:hypothetical protein
MIRNGKPWHVVCRRLLIERLNAGGPVEQGVLGMDVEMGKFRHVSMMVWSLEKPDKFRKTAFKFST